ncbi:MAG: hypothetical protein OEV78_04615 [Spirochaetia bacterium]|nr:hypothetical protein [Spirochaetia bacterium]
MSTDVALIELGENHQECLYAQLLFLKKAGYNVHLIVSKQLIHLINYSPIWNQLYLHDVNGSSSILELYKISRYFKKNKIKKIIFNTAENAVVRNLLFLTPKIQCYGILHDVLKINSSQNQKIISRRIKNYFILNDYLKNSIEEKYQNKVSSFYPIFFPEIKDSFKPAKNKIMIVIPGQLELKRRDYISLIDVVEKAKFKSIKFVLLGNCARGDGEKIKQYILNKKLESQFILFHEYLSENAYHAWIKSSDFIMPLLHPDVTSVNSYLTKNISGAFNFAFAYKKPMFMHEAFSGIDDFQVSSIFYNILNLASKIKSIESKPEQIQKIIKKINSYSKFSFDFQYNNYIQNL